MSRIVHCQILTEGCTERLSPSFLIFLLLCLLPGMCTVTHMYTLSRSLSLSLFVTHVNTQTHRQNAQKHTHTCTCSSLNHCAPVLLWFINIYLWIASIRSVMLRFPILLIFAVLLHQFVKCTSSTKYFTVLRYSINFHSCHRGTLVIFKKDWQLLFTSSVPLSLNSKTLAVLLCTDLYCQTHA